MNTSVGKTERILIPALCMADSLTSGLQNPEKVNCHYLIHLLVYSVVKVSAIYHHWLSWKFRSHGLPSELKYTGADVHMTGHDPGKGSVGVRGIETHQIQPLHLFIPGVPKLCNSVHNILTGETQQIGSM